MTRLERFNAMVDAELIKPFQVFVYYPIIIAFTLYLALFADGPPQGVDAELGDVGYYCWLMLGSVFPAASLLGRYLFESAAKTAEGDPNSAYGGAWLMFGGDFGVWMAIDIYLYCVFGAAWWGEAFWGLGFVLMGVPGGAIFTYRSMRRLRQIRRRLP
jgi:hypothetical protein